MLLILNGVHGPLRRRDLQMGGAMLPEGAALDTLAPADSRAPLAPGQPSSYHAWSGEIERYVYNTRLALLGERKPALFEYLQHRRVFRQDLCGKFLKPGRASDGNQML